MPFFVYIIYSQAFDRYYTGQTNNFAQRLQYHNNGFGKATAPYIPWKLVCLIEKNSRMEAMELERKLKNLNRIKLLEFIKKYAT